MKHVVVLIVFTRINKNKSKNNKEETSFSEARELDTIGAISGFER